MMSKQWDAQEGDELVLVDKGNHTDSKPLDSKEKILLYINSLENVADGLFEALNSFEVQCCEIVGLDFTMSTLTDISTILKNLVNEDPMYMGIDEDKIINNKKEGDKNA